MDTHQKLLLLKQSPLFHNLKDSSIELIAQKAQYQNLDEKTIFIREGEVSSNVYFILSGSARIYKITEDGGELNIGIAGKGEILGEMALIDNVSRSADVETLQKTEVLIFQGSDFKEIIRDPDISLHMLQIMTRRLRENNAHLETLVAKSLKDRTYTTLYLLSHHFPNRTVTLSQEELASIIGATRARVTEELHALEEEGKISLSHRSIQVL